MSVEKNKTAKLYLNLNGSVKGNVYPIIELSLKENSNLDKVEENIKSINELLRESSDFKEIILNPTISKEEKKNVTITAAKKSVKPKTSVDLSSENVLNKLDNEIRRYRFRDNYSI